MKTFCLFLLFFHIQNIVFPQNTRFNRADSSLITDAEYTPFDLSQETNSLNTNLPFKGITFFDMRYDTSFIAINWQANPSTSMWTIHQNRKLNLSEGLARGLTNYFNYYFTGNFSKNAELICYIKNFSVGLKDTLLESRKDNETINQVKFEAECYYKLGDNFYPAVRIDTTYSKRITQVIKNASSLTKEILNPLIKRILAIDTLKIMKRTAYNSEQISDRYQTRFQLPILQDSAYNTGVYKTFQEFINNQPSITKYTIAKEKNRVLLYDENENIISNVFGFNDGKDFWIFKGAFCSKLIRIGNAFEYFFTIYIRWDYVYTTAKKYLFSLNMETGKTD